MALAYTTPDEIRREFITQLSTSDDPALAKIIDWSSRYIDRKTGRQFWTTTGDEVRIFDGPEKSSYCFYPRVDIASLTAVDLALDAVAASSGTYTTLSTADWFLQPADRPVGWPGWYVEVATAANGTYSLSTEPFTQFNPGLRTVRLTGKFGWDATSIDSTGFPQDIRLVAVEVAVKAWRTRETGYSNIFGASEVGIATIERQLSPFARDILDSYTRYAVV